MTAANAFTFQQALKKNFKRVLVYWAPLSFLLAGLGTLLGFYTLWSYTTAIGRPDLLAGAIEAKSALIPWMAMVALMVAAYLLILMGTTVMFGLAVSLFNDCASLQSRVVFRLLIPVLLGIIALMALIFHGPELDDYERLACLLGFFLLAPLLLHLSSTFRLAKDTCATMAAPKNPKSKMVRFWFLVMLSLLLSATVFSAVFPASLVLKTYSGDDTPQAVNLLMGISMLAASITLLPVVVFYVSQSDPFKRFIYCITAVLFTLITVIGISPGGTSSIVYSAALLGKARAPVEAKFLITQNYSAEDFDPDTWGRVTSLRNQPLISAFPLFSFGDVLLLCPVSLIKTPLQAWPEYSSYCVVTQNSKAIRMPKKSDSAGTSQTMDKAKPNAQGSAK